MNFHPYCEVFPLLEGEAFEELVADIKANGLREEIWMYQGMVLDGRNRFRACQKANERLRTRDFKGTDQAALALVISANVHRRHLTASQLAMAAAKIANLKTGSNQHLPKNKGSEDVGGPKGTTSEAPISIESASKMVGAKPRSTKRARKVIERGSKPLQAAVESGEVPVTRAASVVDLPKSEQLKAAKGVPPKTPGRPAEVASAPDLDLTDYEPDDDDAYKASIENVMMADDKLAAMRKELEEVYRQLHVMTESRNHFQAQAGEATRLVKVRDREIERLKKRLDKLEGGAKAA